MTQHILFQQTPARAGRLHISGLQSVLVQRQLRRRHDPRFITGLPILIDRPFVDLTRVVIRTLNWFLAPIARACLHQGHHGADGADLASRFDNLAQNAVFRRQQLHRRFLGFQDGNRLILADCIACLLQPFADFDFGDGFADCRDLEFDGHDV
jgi:hypothetical protein